MDEVQNDQKEVQIPEPEKKDDPSDRLTPDHPRFKQVLDKLDKKDAELERVTQELSELKSKLQDRKDIGGEGELTPDEEAALKKIKQALSKDGFLTKSELNSIREVDHSSREFERLTERYDGKNGLPKFIADDVAAFSKRNGFGSNYEAAYKQMHFDAIVDHEAKKRGEGPKPPSSERPTGGERQVQGTSFTPDQIAAMSPDEYEKNRPLILRGVKPS